jgi:hypothetical protein
MADLTKNNLTRKSGAEPSNEEVVTEPAFKPLQEIPSTIEEQKKTEEKKISVFDPSGEKPVLLYDKGATDVRPILDVRKPAFRPKIEQKEREKPHKAVVELPEE